MPDATIRDLVLKRLEADTQPEDEEGPEAAKALSFRGAGARVGGADWLRTVAGVLAVVPPSNE